MKYVKQFRVADLVVCPHDNSHYIFVCSMWGDYYKVVVDKFDNGNWGAIWSKGMIVEVPLVLVQENPKSDRAMVPDWSAFGEGAATQFELIDAYDTVCHIWGREIAERYLPLDSPPASVVQAVMESEVRELRRRKSETQKPESTTEPPANDEKGGGQQTLFE